MDATFPIRPELTWSHRIHVRFPHRRLGVASGNLRGSQQIWYSKVGLLIGQIFPQRLNSNKLSIEAQPKARVLEQKRLEYTTRRKKWNTYVPVLFCAQHCGNIRCVTNEQPTPPNMVSYPKPTTLSLGLALRTASRIEAVLGFMFVYSSSPHCCALFPDFAQSWVVCAALCSDIKIVSTIAPIARHSRFYDSQTTHRCPSGLTKGSRALELHRAICSDKYRSTPKQ